MIGLYQKNGLLLATVWRGRTFGIGRQEASGSARVNCFAAAMLHDLKGRKKS